MLDAETKRRIDTCRDILVGKVPDPKSQVEQITIALIYKFMDDMDREAEDLGGQRSFFAGDFAHYGWARLKAPELSGKEKLGLDTIDLFLIHWPLPTLYDGDYVSTWRTMASFVEDGRAASVGVSNFQPAHLERIVAETGVVPAVNQVEVHPYFTNEAVRTADAQHGIATEAWSPIAQGKVLGDPVITEIAQAKGVSPAQVTLRWHIARGDIVFPKSVRSLRSAGRPSIASSSWAEPSTARLMSM